MENIKFISSKRVISTVQEDLSSFDANNQIDPGRWYSMIRKVVSDLGIACFKPGHALVWIKNYRGELPCDFQILDSAFMVHENCHEGIGGIINYQGRSIIWDDTTTACAHEGPSCEGSCEFRTCEVTEFNQITVREYVRGLPQTYNYPVRYPLHVNNRLAKAWCLPKSICFGSTSKQEISINNGEIYTNFEEGIILLNYYSYPYDSSGLPEMPDSPKVALAVEHYLKWKTLENLWVNNDDLGVQQKMMYFKNEFEQNSYPDAEFEVKLTSMNSMTDMIRNSRKSLNMFQLIQK